MTEYAICFDFPEVEDPVFAGLVGDPPGFAFVFELERAVRFGTEESAEAALENAYGAESRKFGSVVEMA